MVVTALEPWQVLALLLLANLLGVWAGRGSRHASAVVDLELARADIARLEGIIADQAGDGRAAA